MKKYIPYIFVAVAFIIGLKLGTTETPDKKEIKNKEKTIASNKKSIDSLINIIEDLGDTIINFEGQIKEDSIKYNTQRKKPISAPQTIINEEKVLDFGIKNYGEPAIGQERRNLLSSYSAQAVDEVVVLRKIKQNQKAIVSNQAGVILHKDTIIYSQEVIIKEIKKKGKRKGWIWFTAGFLTARLIP